MATRRKIWCTECGKAVLARLTTGKEVHAQRPALHNIPFWICDDCGNYVGCHYKTANKTKPLGTIASKPLAAKRYAIHKRIEYVMQVTGMAKSDVYKYLTHKKGFEYHTGELKNVAEATEVLNWLRALYAKDKVTLIEKGEA